MATQFVIVKLELGHKASYRAHVSPKGFTHDWSIYVRGADGADIQHFVDKVVFRLHETFERPVQVRREPPYSISESGYASFELLIDIHFKNDEEPNMITYRYDLYLPAEGSPPVKHYRQEKLTFKNPPDEFRKRLIQGGGIATDSQSSVSTAPAPSAPMTGSGSDSSTSKGSLKAAKSGSTPGKELRTATDSDSKVSSSTKGDGVSSQQRPAAPDKKQSQQAAAARAGSADDNPKSSDKRHSESKVPEKGSDRKDSSKSSKKSSSKESEKSQGGSGVGGGGGGGGNAGGSSGNSSSGGGGDKERPQPSSGAAASDKTSKDREKASKDASKSSKSSSSSLPTKESSSKQPRDLPDKPSTVPLPDKSREDGSRAGSVKPDLSSTDGRSKDISSPSDRQKSSSSNERSRDSGTVDKSRESSTTDRTKDSGDRTKGANADRQKDAGDKGKHSSSDRSKAEAPAKESQRSEKSVPPPVEKAKTVPSSAVDYGGGTASGGRSSSGGGSSSRSSKPEPKPRRTSEDKRSDRPVSATDKSVEPKKPKAEAGSSATSSGGGGGSIGKVPQPAAPTAVLTGSQQRGPWDSSSSDESDGVASPSAALFASKQPLQPPPPPAAGQKGSVPGKPGSMPVSASLPPAARGVDSDRAKPDASKSKSPTKAPASQPDWDDRSRKAPGGKASSVAESPGRRPPSAPKRTSAYARRTDDDDDEDDGGGVGGEDGCSSGSEMRTVREPPAKISHMSGENGDGYGMTRSRDMTPPNSRAAAHGIGLSASAPSAPGLTEVPEVPAAASLASAAAAAALASRSHQRAPNGILVGELLGLHEKIRLLTDPLVIQQVVDIIEDTGMYKITEKSFDFDLCLLDSKIIKKLEQCLQ